MQDSNCVFRSVILEDLDPMKMDTIGAAFDLDATFFGTHLQRSGYVPSTELRETTEAWSNFQPVQRYCTIKWLRFRYELLRGRLVKAPCFEGRPENHEFQTDQNIFRRPLALCAVAHQSECAFPVGWKCVS
jgi:hypothetical protein